MGLRCKNHTTSNILKKCLLATCILHSLLAKVRGLYQGVVLCWCVHMRVRVCHGLRARAIQGRQAYQASLVLISFLHPFHLLAAVLVVNELRSHSVHAAFMAAFTPTHTGETVLSNYMYVICCATMAVLSHELKDAATTCTFLLMLLHPYQTMLLPSMQLIAIWSAVNQ